MEVLGGIFVVLIIVVGVVYNIYDHTSHSMVRGFTLREDAVISNIKTDSVGGRKVTTASIRTTVIFDDGFTYISHKSGRRPFEIYVDYEVLEEIKKDAIIAHQKAYEKQNCN